MYRKGERKTRQREITSTQGAEYATRPKRTFSISFVPVLIWPIHYTLQIVILYQEITKSEKLEYYPPEVTKTSNLEIWWDKSVKTINKVKKNKPDIVIWNQQDKTCKIVEVSVPLDMNLRQAREDKESKYIPLISQLQQMYRGYKSSNTNLNRSPRIHTPRTEKEYRANWNTEIENNNSKRTNTKSGNTWDGENMQNNTNTYIYIYIHTHTHTHTYTHTYIHTHTHTYTHI